MSNTYIGSRAEQLMNGFINIVMMRLERLSIERDAMMDGTVHPNPITNGMNDFPWSPRRCITLSIINAARAMYPESSMNDMHR